MDDQAEREAYNQSRSDEEAYMASKEEEGWANLIAERDFLKLQNRELIRLLGAVAEPYCFRTCPNGEANPDRIHEATCQDIQAVLGQNVQSNESSTGCPGCNGYNGNHAGECKVSRD